METPKRLSGRLKERERERERERQRERRKRKVFWRDMCREYLKKDSYYKSAMPFSSSSSSSFLNF